MDIQLKKGLLEICVLKILEQQDSYGYQIIKDLSNIIQISESTLYPILKRLEINQYLTVYTSEHNGRLRKYFSITDNGKQRIKHFLKEWEELIKIYHFIKEGQYD